MSKKRKKHGYAERLKYMHMLENGCSKNYIHTHYGIDDALLGHLWTRYQSEGPSGLLKKRNVKADYAFKLQVVRDIEENHLTLVDASLKYNVSDSQIRVWKRIAKTQGYEALAIIRPRGRPPKNDMGRPKKKKPEEMTELERLRYENECLRAENALLKKVTALVEAREARLKEIGRKPSKN
jgi:transposase-like protein